MTGPQTSGGGAHEGRARVAVIGAGRWGEHHTRVFSSHPDAELCAVVARHLDRAETRTFAVGWAPLHLHGGRVVGRIFRFGDSVTA